MRDGRKREFAMLPEAIAGDTYTDSYQLPVRVLLASQRSRLRAGVKPKQFGREPIQDGCDQQLPLASQLSSPAVGINADAIHAK